MKGFVDTDLNDRSVEGGAQQFPSIYLRQSLMLSTSIR